MGCLQITVTDGGGGSAPVAEFAGSPRSGNYPLAVSFGDQSSNNPESWYWTFGDGSASTTQNPVKVYQNMGYYNVSLKATNPYGQDTATKDEYINVTKPAACVEGAYDCQGTTRVQCMNGSWVPIEINSELCGYVPPPPQVPSFKKVCLKNQKPSKCTPSATISIEDQTPAIDATPIFYQTDFGDGVFSQDYNPTHTYNKAGTYDIEYTVCYDDGGQYDGQCYAVTDPITIEPEGIPVPVILLGGVLLAIGYIALK